MMAAQPSSNEALMVEFRAKIKECELHAYCKRPFLRVEKLRQWLGTHVGSLLEATYQQWHSPELPITAEELCEKQSGLLLFSILLELGRGEYVHVFGPEGVMDNLPITSKTLERALRAIAESDIPKANVKSLWEDFDRLQWRYCPPKLKYRKRARYYDPNYVIPILRKEPINTKGGTAKVWQIEVLEEFIEPDLRKIVSKSKFDRKDKDPSDALGWRYNFALKVFDEERKAEYDNEIEAFRALKDQDGLIAYLGDFQQRDPVTNKTTYNILLEFGELDLDEYFFERSPPVLTAEIVHFWKDLFEVARAVKDIHIFTRPRGDKPINYYGWHADIKPDNILLVRGDFKLADPGFARFEQKEAFEKLGRERKTMVHGGTMTYGAPECHPGREKHVPVPRSIDIWSLGCVFSVAASWIVLGEQGIRQFEEVRKMAISNLSAQSEEPGGDYFHDGTKVLPEVLQWHEYLRKTCRKSDRVTSEVLDLVDQKMLMAQGYERIDAADLVKELKRILEKGQASQSFTLPESLRNALVQMDEKATTQPHRPAANVSRIGLKSETHLGTGEQKDRKERKSQRYAETKLLKTPNRSEVLKPPSLSSLPSQQNSNIMPINEAVGPVPSLPATLKLGSSIETAATAPQHVVDRRHHQTQRSLGNPPNPHPMRATTSSVVLTPKSSDRDVQNVWQARADLDRRKSIIPLKGAGKDERLSRHFKNRDIHFLVDNAGTMADFWDEAIFLLETLVMKAKGQDENGMDLSFVHGNVRIRGSNREKKFTEKMEDPGARPSLGSTARTDIRKPLGDILHDYIEDVRNSRRHSNSKKKDKDKLKDLTIIIFTDGKWEGMADKDTVMSTIVEFSKELEKIQGKGFRMRQVSFQFVQFGFDADATYLLHKLDDEMPGEDIVDTEPARGGDVNKMLLGSFVEEYDEKQGDELILFPSTPTRSSSHLDLDHQPRTSATWATEHGPLTASPPMMGSPPIMGSPPMMGSPPPQEPLSGPNPSKRQQSSNPTPEFVFHHAHDEPSQDP